ncbi:MAG: RluA family pseudouridine synthase [Candidatus Woykebacteria bacterium]
MRKIELKVTPKERRLDQFLAAKVKSLSRSQIKKLIHEENIKVNSQPTTSDHKPTRGDVITLEIPLPRTTEVRPENIPLKIVYEDKGILVIDKEAGLVTHPTLDHPSGTLVNAVLFYLKSVPGSGESLRPGIVHRLDKGTSGLIVVAKNEKSLESLKKQFKERSVVKKYTCLVQGRVEKTFGSIDAPIGRHVVNRKKFAVDKEGREAMTKYSLISHVGEKFDLLEAAPKTGRTHQIRVHLSHIGHPIVGDRLYGGKALGRRQFLHASYLEFTHPKTGIRIHFESKLPPDLQIIFDRLGERNQQNP